MNRTLKDIVTERDNETVCLLRVVGLFCIPALFFVAAPLEIASGVAVILAAIAGGSKLKDREI